MYVYNDDAEYVDYRMLCSLSYMYTCVSASDLYARALRFESLAFTN